MSVRDQLLSQEPRDRAPSEDAEQAVLSEMMLDVSVVPGVAQVLRTEHFVRPRNGRIFSALCALAARGLPILDPISLAEELAQRGELAAIGGKDYIGTLLDIAPTAANVMYHARIVRDHADRRALTRALQDATALVDAGEWRRADVAGTIRQALDEIERGQTASDLVRVLEGDAPEPPAMLVRDLLVDRDVNLWAAFGGSAKSTLMLHTAVCVALGRPVFGTLAVQRPGPVLLVVPEDGRGVVQMILNAIIAGLALGPAERATLTERLVMVKDEVAVDLMRDTARLRQWALEIGAVLVVLDPLGNLIGTAKIDDDGVAKVTVAALRRDVCRGAGAATLINHHNRKPGKDTDSAAPASRHDMRGAAGWADSARLVFAISKSKNDLTLACTKANRLRADLKHELRLAIEADPVNRALWRSCTISDRNAGAASEAFTPGAGRPLNANERTVLAALDDRHEPGTRLSWSQWRDRAGLKSEDTFKGVLHRLLDAGLASAMPTGRKTRNGSPEYSYGLTEKGRAELVSGPGSNPLKGEGVRSGE